MKRLLALLAGGLGIGALLRRRRRSAAVAAPAEELRAKLAASRVEEEREPAAEPADADEPADVNGRRADVHERARRAIDELRDRR